MNLAPIRYAQVEVPQGGPVAKILVGKLRIGEETYYQANAWLSDTVCQNNESLDNFSTASGTGTDRSELLARYKAISEALERWAFQELTRTGETGRFGFYMEPSTTGMAAFPGLFGWQSRKRAKLEAIERYCVNEWWHGRLGAVQQHQEEQHIIQIENPLSSDSVILTWKSFADNLYAYGTAASSTTKAATHQALIEMERSAVALIHYRKQRPDLAVESVRAIRNYGERQILYYSLPEGHATFLKHLDRRPIRKTAMPPAPLIDCVIPGPWQKYAIVWRVLYPMETTVLDASLGANFLY